MSATLKPLVIHHHPCADGFAAAWCFHHRFGDAVDFHAAKYGHPVPSLVGRPVVYLVDFSYPPEVLLAAVRSGTQVYVIDHHKSAMHDWMAWLAKHAPTSYAEEVDATSVTRAVYAQEVPVGSGVTLNLHFNMDMSGATLAWDFCFPDARDKRPLLLGHIEDRDLWRFKLPHTAEIQANVFSHPYDFAVWDDLMATNKTGMVKMAAGGEAIQRKHTKDVAELLAETNRFMWIGGRSVPVCNVPYTMASDTGQALAEMARASAVRGLTDEDLIRRRAGDVFGATYFDDREHRCFSLRSLDDGADVSQIAAAYGGGGHARAAGFKVPRAHPLAKC